MSFRIALVALSALSLTAAANAQIVPQRYGGTQRSQQLNQQAALQQQQAQTQMQPQPVPFKGTIEGVAKEGIRVSGGDQPSQSWQVYLTPETKVHVTGTAEANFLKKGLILEFQAELDAQAKGKSDVGALIVTTSSHDKPLGLSTAEHGAVKTKTIEPGQHHVIGRVLSFQDNLLTVQAGRSKVQVKVTESPKITVDMTNWALAMPFAAEGDKITGTGMSVPNRAAIARASRVHPRPSVPQNPQAIPGQMPGQGSQLVQAQEVNIEMSEPLSNGKKKAVAKATPKDAASRAKKGEEDATKAADAAKKGADDATKAADAAKKGADDAPKAANAAKKGADEPPKAADGEQKKLNIKPLTFY